MGEDKFSLDFLRPNSVLNIMFLKNKSHRDNPQQENHDSATIHLSHVVIVITEQM